MPALVGLAGRTKVPAVKNEVSAIEEPPLTSQETVLEFGLHEAMSVVVPVGAR
jgi:hypothetical protein